MAGLFDYLLWRGDLSAQSSPLNEVDYMILSRITYLPFELVMEQGDMNGALTDELCMKMSKLPDIQEKMVFKDDAKLMELLTDSPRFGKLRVIGCVNQLDDVSQTQFSAVTIELEKGKYYIGFRGTDNTLVGWKEDFNMALIYPVPAQRLALRYLEKIASEVSGSFIVGGHSKGGNLAVYASALCPMEIQNRIKAIYNFDGPGFNDEFLQSEGFGRIWDRVFTYVPQSSVIGMLFGNDCNYTIVKSSRYGGLLQHDTYSWDIERDRFIHLETVDGGSKAIDYAVKEWIGNMNYEQRELFIDTIYTVLSETNAHTFKEMGENWFFSAGAVLKSLKNLDEGTRKAVMGALRALVKSTRNGIKKVISEKGKNNG